MKAAMSRGYPAIHNSFQCTEHPRTTLGIALPTVMVMLLLSSGLVLTAWRSIWLHELLLQARADALRTQWLADATLLAALDDVLQRNAFTDVSASASASANTNPNIAAPTSMRHTMGSADQSHVFFPKTADELLVLRQRLGASACREGICAPLQPSTSVATYWQSMVSTSMAPSVLDPSKGSGAENNPLQNKTARYWVEIFIQTDSSDGKPFVYRITAIVSGWKSAQPTVLQAIWQPDIAAVSAKNNATSGRWVSWAVLHAP
jgi:Tfp pilus assembly protein PilX